MPNTAAPVIEIVTWGDPRAVAVREAMDAELGARYADRFNGVDPDDVQRMTDALTLDPATLVATILAHDAEGRPVGHAALRRLAEHDGALEVKRVYVHPDARGTGVSRLLMTELERIAASFGAVRLILQTGDRQPDAIALYERIGYSRIPIFHPYEAITFSQCFEKVIAS